MRYINHTHTCECQKERPSHICRVGLVVVAHSRVFPAQATPPNLMLLTNNVDTQILRGERLNSGIRRLFGRVLLHQRFHHRKPLRPNLRRYMPRWALLRGGFPMAGAMPNWDILRSTGISYANYVEMEAAKQTSTAPTAWDNEPNRTGNTLE